MDKRALVVVGAILLIPVVLLGIWAFQGRSMKGDFAEALRMGAVKGVHRDLQDKRWSPAELASIEVIMVPAGFGRERALTRSAHSRGRIFVPSSMYEYQGTVRDSATDIVHVFGYRRSEPRHWCWAQFHPDSAQIGLQRRMEQLEEMRQRAAEQ